MSDARRGLALGLLGVVLFSLTLPMTRLAVGAAGDPQLPPVFVTAGRAAAAGLLSLLFLHLTGAPALQRRHLGAMAVCALGTVVGFPWCLALAMREVNAMHGAVVTGVLPLGTAIAAALYFRQRPSRGFWVSAGLGAALVIAFAVQQGDGRLSLGDALLLGAVAAGSVGYVAGARLAADLPAEQVICWVLVLSLPFTVPVALAAWPSQPVRPGAWAGFGYVAVVSMWLGFFAWYRGLALGGAVRVSQVQLLQPFLSILFAAPLLGEPFGAATLGFALAIVAVVCAGRSRRFAAPGGNLAASASASTTAAPALQRPLP